MARPRSNKLQNKGRGTPFGKQTDAEKSFRKRDRRPPAESSSRSGRSSDFKPRSSGYRSEDGGKRGGSTSGKGPYSKGPYAKKPGNYRSSDKPDFREGKRKSFGADRGENKPFRKSGSRPFPARPEGPPRFTKSPYSKPGGRDRDDNAVGKSQDRGEYKPFRKNSDKPFSSRPGGPHRFSKSSYPKSGDRDRGEKPFGKSRDRGETGEFSKRPYPRKDEPASEQKPERKSFVQARVVRSGEFTKTIKTKSADQGPQKPNEDGLTRLNKYIANSGVGSRREADELIKMGLIKVNGVTITQLGTKVKPGDEIRYEDRVLRAEKPVYVLLNKPKGFITTTDDPQERSTVMGLVAGACKERIYPVGRLDRNTTGLLLLTNDGDLADKLTHPSYNTKKVYKIELDRPLTKNDLQKISEGVRLEEGRAMVDDCAIISDDNKTVGLEIHIGWNRVVRRIFEALGYEVVKLDRSVFAGLDKKDLSRGQWRFLTPEEIVRLKHFK